LLFSRQRPTGDEADSCGVPQPRTWPESYREFGARGQRNRPQAAKGRAADVKRETSSLSPRRRLRLRLHNRLGTMSRPQAVAQEAAAAMTTETTMILTMGGTMVQAMTPMTMTQGRTTPASHSGLTRKAMRMMKTLTSWMRY